MQEYRTETNLTCESNRGGQLCRLPVCKTPVFCFLTGGPEGIWTPDLHNANVALSQLSYRPTKCNIKDQRLSCHWPWFAHLLLSAVPLGQAHKLSQPNFETKQKRNRDRHLFYKHCISFLGRPRQRNITYRLRRDRAYQIPARSPPHSEAVPLRRQRLADPLRCLADMREWHSVIYEATLTEATFLNIS